MDVSKFQNVANGPVFSYEKNATDQRVFIILKRDEVGGYEPVGTYTVTDVDENISFTEKKVKNLVSVLNGKRELVDLSGETDKRLLFHRKPKDNDSDRTEIIFYALGDVGTSKENAVLILDEGDV